MSFSLLGALLGVGTASLLQWAVRSHQPIAIIGVLLLLVAILRAALYFGLIVLLLGWLWASGTARQNDEH